MIEVSALLFTLLAEGTGLLSIILIIWIIVSIRKKSKDKAAAQKLVNSIRKSSEERLESINAFLTEFSGQEDEELKLNKKKIDRVEKDFFTQLVRLYIRRDSAILSTMDEQLNVVISTYKENMSKMQNEGASPEEDIKSLAKIESLEKEKEALGIELKITKSTMGNMMSEFNTMFSGGNETVQTSKEALQTSVADVEKSLEPTDVGGSTDDDIDMNIDEVEINEVNVKKEAEPQAIDDEGKEDVFFSTADAAAEPSAPTSISKTEDDFGSIVSSGDVDDLLDGIDLSKEIDS